MKISFTIIIPVLLIVAISVLIYNPSKKINSNNDSYNFEAFSDAASGGNSIVKKEILDNGNVEIKYILKDRFEYPYGGLIINYADYSLMDFSDYHNISLEIKSNESNFLVIQFTLFIDGFSKQDQYETYLPASYYLKLDKGRDLYNIRLEDLKPQIWWISRNNVSEELIRNISFEAVASIEIVTDPSFPLGKDDTITFSGITFNRNLKQIVVITLIVLAVYYLIYLLIMTNFKKRSSNSSEKVVFVPYNGSINDSEDTPQEILHNYIFANYKDPLLNIAMVEAETNISERNIAKIIKEKYNYSFPSFINNLRVTEAKRLLETTDKKIVDIAMLVGYNSLGHFNRTFKKIENYTPSEYKKCKK